MKNMNRSYDFMNYVIGSLLLPCVVAAGLVVVAVGAVVAALAVPGALILTGIDKIKKKPEPSSVS